PEPARALVPQLALRRRRRLSGKLRRTVARAVHVDGGRSEESGTADRSGARATRVESSAGAGATVERTAARILDGGVVVGGVLSEAALQQSRRPSLAFVRSRPTAAHRAWRAASSQRPPTHGERRRLCTAESAPEAVDDAIGSGH